MDILSLLNTDDRYCQMKKLRKGETLFYENDLCHHIGIIKDGRLIITSFLENGRQIIYNRLHKGEMFGNNLVFSGDPRYKGDVIAEEDSEVYLIEKEDLLHLLQENEALLKEYLKIQADAGKDLHGKIRLLSFEAAEDRFNYWMHEHGGQIEITSISSLAEDLHLSRETLSRLLSRLEKENRIIRDGKTIGLL